MAIRDELVSLTSKEGTLVNNKVCNFAYDNTAYEDDTSTGADGVATYNYNNHNNIPIKDNSVLKVNPTITAKGFRTQVSTLPRMLMNHIFGRVSYNLNKTVDVLYTFLVEFTESIGASNGLATLDEDGRVPYSQLPLSAVEYKGTWNANTNTPHLSAGTGTFGDEYIVSVAGTQNIGEGSTLFLPSDRVIYNGSIWQKISSGAVRKVNNVSPDTNGNVALNADNILTPDVYGYNEANAGKAWVESTGVTNTSFEDVCAHNGLFVAISTGTGLVRTFYYSSDGISWLPASNSPQVTHIKYLNGRFFAYGSQIYTSDDGKTWTQVSNFSDFYVYDIDFAEGIYVLTNQGNTDKGIYWSTDLSTWTRGKQTGYADSIVFANGLWIVREYGSQSFQYTMYWSTDGKNWTECTGYQSSTSSQQCYFASVLYGNGIWFARAIGTSAPSFAGIWKSTDGKAWTKVTDLESYSPRGLYYLNNKWIIPITRGFLVSEDNTTWTEISAGNITAEKFTFDNGIYLSYYNNRLYWSTNLADWTQVTGLPSTSTYNFGLAFSDKTWVCTTDDGIYYSKGTATNNVSEILDWLLTEVDRLSPAPSLSALYIYEPKNTGNLQDGIWFDNQWGSSQKYRTLMISTINIPYDILYGSGRHEFEVMFVMDIFPDPNGGVTPGGLWWCSAKVATVHIDVVSDSGGCGGLAQEVTYDGNTYRYSYQSQHWAN